MASSYPIFDTRTDVLVKVSKFFKMSPPEGDSNSPTFAFKLNALTIWPIRARHLLSHVFEHCLWQYIDTHISFFFFQCNVSLNSVSQLKQPISTVPFVMIFQTFQIFVHFYRNYGQWENIVNILTTRTGSFQSCMHRVILPVPLLLYGNLITIHVWPDGHCYIEFFCWWYIMIYTFQRLWCFLYISTYVKLIPTIFLAILSAIKFTQRLITLNLFVYAMW